MVEVPLKLYVQDLLKQAKAAVRGMSVLSSDVKNQVLMAMADQLETKNSEIREGNEKDLANISKDLGQQAYREMVERIKVTDEDIERMTQYLRDLVRLPDPIGEVNQAWMTEDGLQVHKMRSPLGVLGVISDLGPQMTVESFGMSLKTNNVCMYRGGAEWLHTNLAMFRLFQSACKDHHIPEGGMVFLDRTEPEAALEVARRAGWVQALVLRGRTRLRQGVLEQARVPVIGFEGGLCHVYVDQAVDIPLAQMIAVNAKIQDPSSPNSLDTLLIHQGVARYLLPGLTRRMLQEFKVTLYGCPKTVSMLGVMEMTGHLGIREAKKENWETKFQTMEMNIKVVKDSEEALDHIAQYSPGHTDTIVTRDYELAMRFVREVDSSAVCVNASTRLHGGDGFGLGPEIGTNSSHLHCRGPLTLSSLTVEKYMVLGTGQLKQPHPIPQEYQDAMMLSSKF